MSYNDKKFLDQDGLVTLLKKLDNYPTNEILGTVVSAIQMSLGGKVGDVQINGTSIVDDGIANIPIATSDNFGVVKRWTAGGIKIGDDGRIYINYAGDSDIKNASTIYCPVTPSKQHLSVFYGLARAAGDTTQKDSSNEVGIYTDGAKAAIQNMLGVTDLLSTEEFSTATAAHALNSTFMMDSKLYKATAAIVIGDAVVEGQNCEVVKADEVFVKNTDYADANNYGLVKVGGNGITVNTTSKIIQIDGANSSQIKAQASGYAPITPLRQHEAVYYGLSRAAGVSLNNETVEVGTYPETSKAAIRSLIGAGTPLDVQINGSSIISNGIATIPEATSDTLGVIKYDTDGSGGLFKSSSGKVIVLKANTNQIKYGGDYYRLIVPANQHEAAFYGFAKAAGDTTMASSSNAVGTYTETAKAAIRNMLGIGASVELIETVSSTTPTIVGQPNVTYQCGEVSTISITPPANGTIDVYFTSGSTATVLTAPSTIKWPAWFDVEALESDTIYELMITNGIYGSVMTWAL